jgi:two-component system OmpR family sensor kinase
VTGDPEGTVLCVEDRGPGLAPEDLARASDRFYRADASRARSSGGTGLGLAIVQAIVASHGGTTALETGAKGGLRVTVHLPLDHARPDSG